MAAGERGLPTAGVSGGVGPGLATGSGAGPGAGVPAASAVRARRRARRRRRSQARRLLQARGGADVGGSIGCGAGFERGPAAVSAWAVPRRPSPIPGATGRCPAVTGLHIDRRDWCVRPTSPPRESSPMAPDWRISVRPRMADGGTARDAESQSSGGYLAGSGRRPEPRLRLGHGSRPRTGYPFGSSRYQLMPIAPSCGPTYAETSTVPSARGSANGDPKVHEDIATSASPPSVPSPATGVAAW